MFSKQYWRGILNRQISVLQLPSRNTKIGREVNARVSKLCECVASCKWILGICAPLFRSKARALCGLQLRQHSRRTCLCGSMIWTECELSVDGMGWDKIQMARTTLDVCFTLSEKYDGSPTTNFALAVCPSLSTPASHRGLACWPCFAILLRASRWSPKQANYSWLQDLRPKGMTKRSAY